MAPAAAALLLLCRSPAILLLCCSTCICSLSLDHEAPALELDLADFPTALPCSPLALACALGPAGWACGLPRCTTAPHPTCSYSRSCSCSHSCRLGVRAAPLHEFYPSHMTQAFRAALLRFDRQMPGFLSGAVAGPLLVCSWPLFSLSFERGELPELKPPTPPSSCHISAHPALVVSCVVARSLLKSGYPFVRWRLVQRRRCCMPPRPGPPPPCASCEGLRTCSRPTPPACTPAGKVRPSALWCGCCACPAVADSAAAAADSTAGRCGPSRWLRHLSRAWVEAE